MDAIKLGKEIQFLRKERGISQKELSEGICNQSEISRIESGKVFPNVQTLYYISIKLKVSISHFLSVASMERDDYIDSTKETIKLLAKEKKYDDIYRLTSIELNNSHNIVHENYNKFLKWFHLIASYEIKKITYQECLDELNKIKKQNGIVGNADFLDLQILNSIAILYIENGYFEECFQCYEHILNVKNVKIHEFKIFKIKVCYNYGKALLLQGDLDKGIEVINLGIKESKKNEYMGYLGLLYYEKGIYKELSNFPLEEIAIEFITSLFYLLEQNKKSYAEWLKKEKESYFTETNFNYFSRKSFVESGKEQHS
ncbi:helix-turn-helix domain-containing protein [Alkalihalobacterium elongatum]|uniref:helix-turn-helix domain-containing protein n=1 Tax=Alkalihalobacterium elongatum TaxID=2675466 RepID=UPI001C200230|nr:helix-turn-helix domain-containing protein [Alkalihalobacterium elongatum]